MAPIRVVVVDDDRWRREAMAAHLDEQGGLDVVGALDQDDALVWPAERWSGVDVVVVDVLDELAPAEMGTDLYSGITALHRIRDLPLRTVAIVPHPGNALMALRIHESGADAVYHRWELNSPETLVQAVLRPDPERAPRPPGADDLDEFGVRISAQVNEVIRCYEDSELYGHLAPDVGQKSLDVSRRAIDRFRAQIAAAGFDGTELRSTATRRVVAPRWPDVRDFVLRALGRKDVRHTRHD